MNYGAPPAFKHFSSASYPPIQSFNQTCSSSMVPDCIEGSYGRMPTEWIRSEEALRIQTSYLNVNDGISLLEVKKHIENGIDKKTEKEYKRQNFREKRNSVQEWLKSVEVGQDPSLLGPVGHGSSYDRTGVTTTPRAFLIDRFETQKNDDRKEKRDRREKRESERKQRHKTSETTKSVDKSSHADDTWDSESIINSRGTTSLHDQPAFRSLPTAKADILSAVTSVMAHVNDSKLHLDVSNSDLQKSTGASTDGNIKSKVSCTVVHHASSFIRDSEETLHQFQEHFVNASGPDYLGLPALEVDEGADEEEERLEGEEGAGKIKGYEKMGMDLAVSSPHHSQEHGIEFLVNLQKQGTTEKKSTMTAEISSQSHVSAASPEGSSILSPQVRNMDSTWERDEQALLPRSLAEEMMFAEQTQVEQYHHDDEGVFVLSPQILADEDDEDIDVVDAEEDTEEDTEDAFEVVEIDEGGSVVVKEESKRKRGSNCDDIESVSSSVCIV
ncbi:hypothetical protein EV359DRAFT_82927 [Lentinula novae-zelandiae]|nr:hypothetical protein EV359DRAFT_82927 [Lentinula novae-zelandiae]